MAFGLAPVLDRHRIFGGDAEETRAFLSSKKFDLELAPRDAGATPWSGATIMAFEKFIMIMVLTVQPHNFTAAPQRLRTPLAPRDVKRAIDDMRVSDRYRDRVERS